MGHLVQQRVHRYTPPDGIELGQRVTQWMSTVMVWAESAWNSCHVQDLSVSPPCRIENVQSGNGVCGVGPADSTGKLWVTYWPGGSRPFLAGRGAAQVAKAARNGAAHCWSAPFCWARD